VCKRFNPNSNAMASGTPAVVPYPSPAFGIFGSLGGMSGLRECLLMDLRRDRSRREQEEERGVAEIRGGRV